MTNLRRMEGPTSLNITYVVYCFSVYIVYIDSWAGGTNGWREGVSPRVQKGDHKHVLLAALSGGGGASERRRLYMKIMLCLKYVIRVE